MCIKSKNIEILEYIGLNQSNVVQSLEFMSKILSILDKFSTEEITIFMTTYEYKDTKIKYKNEEIMSLSEIFRKIPTLKNFTSSETFYDFDINILNDTSKLMTISIDSIEYLSFLRAKIKDRNVEMLCKKYIYSQNIINTTVAIFSIILQINKPLKIYNVEYDKILELICKKCIFDFCMNQPEFRKGIVLFFVKNNLFDISIFKILKDEFIPFNWFKNVETSNSEDKELQYNDLYSLNYKSKINITKDLEENGIENQDTYSLNYKSKINITKDLEENGIENQDTYFLNSQSKIINNEFIEENDHKTGDLYPPNYKSKIIHKENLNEKNHKSEDLYFLYLKSKIIIKEDINEVIKNKIFSDNILLLIFGKKVDFNLFNSEEYLKYALRWEESEIFEYIFEKYLIFYVKYEIKPKREIYRKKYEIFNEIYKFLNQEIENPPILHKLNYFSLEERNKLLEKYIKLYNINEIIETFFDVEIYSNVLKEYLKLNVYKIAKPINFCIIISRIAYSDVNEDLLMEKITSLTKKEMNKFFTLKISLLPFKKWIFSQETVPKRYIEDFFEEIVDKLDFLESELLKSLNFVSNNFLINIFTVFFKSSFCKSVQASIIIKFLEEINLLKNPHKKFTNFVIESQKYYLNEILTDDFFQKEDIISCKKFLDNIFIYLNYTHNLEISTFYDEILIKLKWWCSYHNEVVTIKNII
ncbi:hypothetical protein CWI39_1398p0010 [Hamiltosporidium magnivora]|uniref:Uncharacterized protein n=1 Tax=Hamiltosporidium magnivora TaxID=148818 RepID=A0A4Q9L3L4_9MICR|nr:hypothetical protein CWI39_1398p0010 [Hamiltosporidium magnivora]